MQVIWNLLLSTMVVSSVSAQELAPPSTSFLPNFVVVGTHAIATCSVTANFNTYNIVSLTWEHNGTLIQASSSPDDKYSIFSNMNNGFSRLEVNELVHEDAGVYRCTVEYSLVSDPQTVLSVFHEDSLKIATKLIVTAEPIHEIKQGEIAILNCTVESFPSPRIAWCRMESDGTETNLILQHSQDEDFGVYQISNVQEEDAGLYKCKGSYSFANQEVTIQLIVLTPPEITSVNEESVPRMSNVTLNCSATGTPNPTYAWDFTAQDSSITIPLVSDVDSRVDVDNVTGDLTITQMTYLDAGRYTCQASNKVGTDTQINRISVIGAPQITLDASSRPAATVAIAKGLSVRLDCPYSSNPVATMRWLSSPDEQEIQNTRYRKHVNGTLDISDVMLSDARWYQCTVTNEYGTDTQLYHLQVIDVPLPPGNLQLSPGSNNTVVELSWTPSPVPVTSETILQPVDLYVVERSINGQSYELLAHRVSSESTTAVVDGLIPGERHYFRLRAKNGAGLSEPSNTATYTPAPTKPKLSMFEASPLSDGRSVVVEWVLEYDGGPNLTRFDIQVWKEGVLVSSSPVGAPQGQQRILDLDPNTLYSFIIVAVNELGESRLQGFVSTSLAPPSIPSSVELTRYGSNSVSISFSIEEGSQHITHFLINMSDVSSNEPPTQIKLAITDSRFVSSLDKVVDSESGRSVYRVVLVLSRLEKQTDYLFQVAAESSLGRGEFSEPAAFELEDESILYIIIAAILGSVLLVIIVIVVAVLIAVGRRRWRRGQKITINSHGMSPLSDATNPTAYNMVRSPSGSQRGGSFPKIPALSSQNSTQDQFKHSQTLSLGNQLSSFSTYNRLAGYRSPLTSTQGFSDQQSVSISGTNLDTVVDMPDNNINANIKTDFHSSTKSMPYSIHGDHSPLTTIDNRQHACLQTSLHFIPIREGGCLDQAYTGSEKHLILSPTESQTNINVISRNSPAVNRISCDSVLDVVPTSYMTDV